MWIEVIPRGDERKRMTKGKNSLKREVETDLRKVEKLLSYNKGKKVMKMVGWGSGERR